MSDAIAYTEDHLLGGQIVLRQPRRGYRAGIDPILLSSSLALKPGAKAVEMGCGAGAALLSAARLYPRCKLTGLENDPEAVHLAQTSIVLNDMEDRVWVKEADILGFKTSTPYDAVFFNPPFFDDPSAMRIPAEEKQAAWMTKAPLADWITAGLNAIKPKGHLTLIHRADRLEEALTALSASGAGSLIIKPVQPRMDKPAKRVLIRATKQGKAPLLLLSPLILHDDSGEKYTAQADDILQGKAHIDWV